jgi:hypothetical protein
VKPVQQQKKQEEETGEDVYSDEEDDSSEDEEERMMMMLENGEWGWPGEGVGGLWVTVLGVWLRGCMGTHLWMQCG